MRLLRRILLILVIVIVLIVLAGGGAFIYSTRRVLPQVDGTITLKGLDGPITIYRDAKGVPQIYASTTHDLFYAQGFVQAQDRWWQMEFNRHVGQGRISELVGKNDTALRNDIFIRTLGWNRAAQANLDAAPKSTLDVTQAFSDGINGYIGGKSGAELALEYSVLSLTGVNIPIEKWKALDSFGYAVAEGWSLSGNADSELQRVNLYKKMGGDAAGQALIDNFYAPPYPYDKKPTIITADELPLKAAPVQTANIPAPVPVIAPGTDLSHVQTNLVGALTAGYGLVMGQGAGIGSNNWVVGGKLTSSGKPILANDPHIDIQMPAIWYEMGLHCTTVSDKCPYDVTGFSFPGTPGIVIGHNAHIAWGVTNVGPDVQDLYIIKVDPTTDTKYELDGKTEDMKVITETIKFGDGTPSKDIRVRMTHFGPIVTDTPAYSKQSDKPLALRWTGISNISDIAGSVLNIDKAADWNTFRSALTTWGVPSQNFVYADTEGNIGYQTPGLIPIRAKGHSGLTPVDGSTTQYDWKGFIPFENLPSVYNPPSGFIATANEALIPVSYYAGLADQLGDKFGKDSNYVISQEWDYGYRAQRIVELLTATPKHTVDTIATVQGDMLSIPAREILPAALKLDYGSDIPKEVLDWMRGWDYQERMTSGQAALYETFWISLATRVWKDKVGYVPDGSNIAWGLTLLLDQPTNTLWGTAGRDGTLRSAMVEAYNTVVKKLGGDYKSWQWSALHHALWISTPLGSSGIGPLENFVNIGPLSVGGGNETVAVSHWDDSDPYDTGGGISSMRVIMDLSNFDGSQWILPTGQSGHATSPHYRDMNDQWRNIQYNVMPWDAAGIKKAAVSTLTLQPG